MRLLRKILLVALLITVGFLGFFYRNNGKFVFGVNVEEVKTQNFDNYQQIKLLDINLDLNELVIESTDKPMIEVEYPIYDDQDLQIIVAQEGQDLRIYNRIDKNLINIAWPSFDSQKSKVTVRIPKNYVLEDLSIQLNMGELTLKEIHSNNTDLTLSMGSLLAKQSRLGALNAKLSMGSVDFKEVELRGDSKFELSMGSFDGSMKAEEGHIKMDVSMGSVDLEMYDGHYKFNTDASMGDVNLKNRDESANHQDFDAVIDIDVSMGDIDIK